MCSFRSPCGQANHATLADRMGYLEKLMGDSFEKHAKVGFVDICCFHKVEQCLQSASKIIWAWWEQACTSSMTVWWNPSWFDSGMWNSSISYYHNRAKSDANDIKGHPAQLCHGVVSPSLLPPWHSIAWWTWWLHDPPLLIWGIIQYSSFKLKALRTVRAQVHIRVRTDVHETCSVNQKTWHTWHRSWLPRWPKWMQCLGTRAVVEIPESSSGLGMEQFPRSASLARTGKLGPRLQSCLLLDAFSLLT